MNNNEIFEKIVAANPDAFEVKNEECPMGDDCALHFRNSERYRDEELKYARYIDYVGEYVVITGMNPMTQEDVLRSLLALALDVDAEPEEVIQSDDFRTEIIRVGEEGVYHDLQDVDDDAFEAAHVYVRTFDAWEAFESRHNRVVKAVRDGLLPR